MKKAILFDLDGTLLPMDQDLFLNSYFSKLITKLSPHGYDPKLLMKAIWQGTESMVCNNGSHTNEHVFWDSFTRIFGPTARDKEDIFLDFYRTEFQQVREVCGFSAEAGKIIQMLKSHGFRVILATNPLFPAIATHSRIRWAGLNPDDFEWITTYENSRFCKPNKAYYSDILQQLSLSPAECVMVGNDVSEDMVAAELGMDVFLLTDSLINKNNIEISHLPQGSFQELRCFLEAL